MRKTRCPIVNPSNRAPDRPSVVPGAEDRAAGVSREFLLRNETLTELSWRLPELLRTYAAVERGACAEVILNWNLPHGRENALLVEMAAAIQGRRWT